MEIGTLLDGLDSRLNKVEDRTSDLEHCRKVQ